MAITLGSVGSGYNLRVMNTNFDLIQDFLNDVALKREVDSEQEANEMRTFLDMNHNAIVNGMTNVDDPTSLLTVEAGDARYINTDGDSLVGDLSLGGYRITDLEAGVALSDAVNVSQLNLAVDAGELVDLVAVARSLNVSTFDIIEDNNTSDLIPDYIYSPTQQRTYSVPADAIGKTIVSVVGSTLNTTVDGPYELVSINNSGVEFSVISDIDILQSVGGKIANLLIGDSVTVFDYAEGNGSGVLFFKVVPAGTGVEDGGKYIDLPTLGLQLKQNLCTPYNPKAWGAVGGGGVDDGDAIYNCHQAQRIAGADMHIPAGHYISNRTIDSDGAGNIAIYGAGVGLTKVSFETAEVGFRFGLSSPVSSVEMKDMEITTNSQSTSFSAIYVNHTEGVRPTSNFENLFIHGVDSSGDISAAAWFQRGIYLINAQQPTIDNCRFIGATATTPSEAARAEAAILITADSEATIPRITRCWSLNYSSGVKIRNTGAGSRIEGVYISECDWVFVNKGVDIVFDQYPAYYAPQITINNMHTEAFQECIYIEGCLDVKISDTLLYAYNSVDPSSLINIVSCSSVKIYDNHLIGRPLNTVNLEGVWIADCADVQVYDNEIVTNGAHIVSSGTTQNMREWGNDLLGTGLKTADISTNSATNKMGKTIDSGADPSYSYYNSEGFLIQGGSNVITLDGSGFGDSVVFPRAFNGSPLSIVISNGDYSAWAGAIAKNDSSVSSTQFSVYVQGASNQSVRVDWQATGV